MSDEDPEDRRSAQEKSCAALLERLRRFHPERDPDRLAKASLRQQAQPRQAEAAA
jgi:hypothetical protein